MLKRVLKWKITRELEALMWDSINSVMITHPLLLKLIILLSLKLLYKNNYSLMVKILESGRDNLSSNLINSFNNKME